MIWLLTFLISTAYAAAPLWTFTPIGSTSGSCIGTGHPNVSYRVTNQSRRTHTLAYQAIPGMNQNTTGVGTCQNPFVLGYQQSCTLSLDYYSSQIQGNVRGGPVVCEKNGPGVQCYQPSPGNQLNVSSANYVITPIAGPNGSISPSAPVTISSCGSQTFTATPSTNYGVNQWLVDGNLAQTGGTTYTLNNISANHTVTVTFVDSISISPSLLGLSVNSTSTNPALTGNPRHFTITNTDTTNPLTGLTISLPNPQLPTGSSYSTTCNSTLARGASCILTITPGSTASSDLGSSPCTSGLPPNPSVFSITATNIAPKTASVDILSYQCIYQAGYIYSVDDTTPNSGSIGGKVAARTDQASPSAGIIWSSDGSVGVSNIPIYGISEISTPGNPNPSLGQIAGQVPCNGNTDGACDTNNIVTYYNANRASGGAAPTPLTQYASGLCKANIGGYTDWYLPAICEMGPASNGSGCVVGTPNMVTNLPSLLGDSCTIGSCLSGFYWSSTEYSGAPTFFAWSQFFASGGVSNQFINNKDLTLGVRCSRALTL